MTLKPSRRREPVPELPLDRPLYDRDLAQRQLRQCAEPTYWPTGASAAALRKRWRLTRRQMAQALDISHRLYDLLETEKASRLPRPVAERLRALIVAACTRALLLRPPYSRRRALALRSLARTPSGGGAVPVADMRAQTPVPTRCRRLCFWGLAGMLVAPT